MYRESMLSLTSSSAINSVLTKGERQVTKCLKWEHSILAVTGRARLLSKIGLRYLFHSLGHAVQMGSGEWKASFSFVLLIYINYFYACTDR